MKDVLVVIGMLGLFLGASILERRVARRMGREFYSWYRRIRMSFPSQILIVAFLYRFLGIRPFWGYWVALLVALFLLRLVFSGAGSLTGLFP